MAPGALPKALQHKAAIQSNLYTMATVKGWLTWGDRGAIFIFKKKKIVAYNMQHIQNISTK